jgi:GNAT superfamily N-acetyltransferase
MRINEIIRSREMPRDQPRRADLTHDYMDRAVRTKYSIKGYPIYQIEPQGRARAQLMLFVASPDETELLGQVALLKNPHRNGTYLFSEIYFDPAIQGQGIAVQLYKLVIVKYGLTIVSDESQSPGSERLWAALAKDPEINVYAWDTEQDTFRDFDPDDPDDVYYDSQQMAQLKQEAETINDRLRDQYINGDITDDEYNQLLSRYLNPIYDDMESMERAQNMRLVATSA